LKKHGNALLAAAQYKAAALAYMTAAGRFGRYGEDNRETDHRVRELTAQCYCNLAMARLKLFQVGTGRLVNIHPALWDASSSIQSEGDAISYSCFTRKLERRFIFILFIFTSFDFVSLLLHKMRFVFSRDSTCHCPLLFSFPSMHDTIAGSNQQTDIDIKLGR
jgi:hypothetical protein